MAEKVISDHETIALIRDTVRERDPYKTCVLLGSSAIVAHFFNIGAESPIGCDDVDALCSSNFFNAEITDMQAKLGVSKVQLRWPSGRRAVRGANNLYLDIYPEAGEAILPFSASFDMSDTWVPLSYELAKSVAIESSGLSCVPLYDILMQLAKIGREKDIIHVKAIVPFASENGLLIGKEVEEIITEIEITEAARRIYPDRYMVV